MIEEPGVGEKPIHLDEQRLTAAMNQLQAQLRSARARRSDASHMAEVKRQNGSRQAAYYEDRWSAANRSVRDFEAALAVLQWVKHERLLEVSE